MALVERHDNHAGAEIGDLERVVAQYPLCRDARRDLGVAYEQQHRTKEALAQFQALQGIDPDDLAAHLHLAGLYRRMGLAREANEEEAQYNKEREDPAAPSYSPDTLRKYPDILIESVPWHVHTDMTPPSELTTEPARKLLDQAPK